MADEYQISKPWIKDAINDCKTGSQLKALISFVDELHREDAIKLVEDDWPAMEKLARKRLGSNDFNYSQNKLIKKISSLPFGTRFSYLDHPDTVFVLLDPIYNDAKTGLVAEWRGIDNKEVQPLYAIDNTYEDVKNLKVIVRDR